MALNIDEHREEEEFERYSMGTISEEERGAFEEHLLLCAPCRQRLTDSDHYVSAVAAASREVRAHPAPRRSLFFTFPRLAWAAAACVVIIGSLVMLRSGPGVSNSSPVAVILQTTRGDGNSTTAPANRPVLVKPDMQGVPSLDRYELQVVDAAGSPVWKGGMSGTAGTVIPALRPGTYFVRVSSPSGQLLREYVLQAQR